jgi:two-component system NtrC family response regulator
MLKTCERYAIGTKGFSPEFLEALRTYEWPGNVRELINAIERAIASARHEPTLYPNHLPTEIRAKIARSSVLRELGGTDPPNAPLATLEEYRDVAERRYLQDLLVATKGNIQGACATSGMSRSRLYALIKKHGLNNSKGPVE